jgi:hypothetical protein
MFLFLSLGNIIRDFIPDLDPAFFHTGSGGKKEHRIPDLDPQHCFLGTQVSVSVLLGAVQGAIAMYPYSWYEKAWGGGEGEWAYSL